MKPLKILIDLDYFLYRAATASEEEHEYTQDLTVIVGNFSAAKKIVQREISQLCERFETRDILVALTDQTNFRKTIDPTYKGNRSKRNPAGYLKQKNW